MPKSGMEPDPDCPYCPRLRAFRHRWREAEPGWFNAPVPGFGPRGSGILIVGLAPGLRGANRTGRPFTGDYAGDLLFATLLKMGLAQGSYDRHAEDGLALTGCRIVNAVRCVPPQNKPTGAEAAACRPFLVGELDDLPEGGAVLALGRVAHNAVLAALGEKQAARPFAHGALHRLGSGRLLADSYHCSRYNTNTGRLTVAMFETAVEGMLEAVKAGGSQRVRASRLRGRAP